MVTRPAPPSMLRHHVHTGSLPERRSVYLAMVYEQLEIRAREHGYAYVTPRESAWFEVNDLRQPGHTILHFFTMDADKSDAALKRSGKAS